MLTITDIKDKGWQAGINEVINCDCLEGLKALPNDIIDCCVTSPPYWGLRDYGIDGQLGLEKTPEEYVAKMVEVFKEVKRVLKKEGTLWLNLGDSYMSLGENRHKGWKDPKYNARGLEISEPQGLRHPTLKPKDLVGIPWRVAFALQKDGWWLRQDIIWNKLNPMPESVTDRCTKAHEYIFLLAKNQKYYFDNEAIKEPSNGVWNSAVGFNKDGQSLRNIEGRIGNRGDKNQINRNKRSVWTVTTKPFKGAHFATFPEDLIRPCVLAGCPKDGIVLDPFFGAGTTGVVAKKLSRNFIGIELNKTYCQIGETRLLNTTEGMF